ncbi:MAG: phosphomannomutase/phosphoglucomutase [Gemmatimonadales bacterium]|nr:phosphomannomutase/phosphoglucomutase [Gemmatimonadales bacterium]
MNVPKSVFRQYDVRGIVERDLTPAFAEALGRAVATLAAERIGRDPVIACGRDNRPSGAALSAGLRRGIAAAGGTAIDVGEVPTPALYFAVHALRTDAGVQVTGSHNPPEFNGFKMVVAGEAIHGDTILGLWETIVTERWRTGAGAESADGSVLRRYKDAIVERHALRRPVKVVVDCGNGVGAVIAVPVLEALGCEVIPLFCESDGTFPNHHPDPSEPHNLVDLQAEVRRSGAELGIAFDGDADRIGAVDEHGTIVFGDQLLVLYGRDAVRRFGGRPPVIFDVKCSEVLPRALSAAGAEPVMWKTGHSLIKAKMKETKAPLAGEMSGHMFFGGDWFGFDDAIFAAARLLELVAAGPGGLHALLADLPATVSTPEIRVECPDDRVKFEIAERAVAHFGARYPVNTIDGVRMTFPDGWGLIRASNTQPVLVMRFEAGSEAALAAYRAEVGDWLRSQGLQG